MHWKLMGWIVPSKNNFMKFKNVFILLTLVHLFMGCKTAAEQKIKYELPVDLANVYEEATLELGNLNPQSRILFAEIQYDISGGMLIFFCEGNQISEELNTAINKTNRFLLISEEITIPVIFHIDYNYSRDFGSPQYRTALPNVRRFFVEVNSEGEIVGKGVNL